MKHLNRLFILLMFVWVLEDYESFAKFWGPIIAKLIKAAIEIFTIIKSQLDLG